MDLSRNFELVDEYKWNETLLSLPEPHFLQSSIWAEIKKDNGWSPHFLHWKNSIGDVIAGTLVLERKIKLLNLISLVIHYCPKGPLLNWSDRNLVRSVLEDIVLFSREHKGLFVKIDPDVIKSNDLNLEENNFQNSVPLIEVLLKDTNWIESKEQIQFRNSIVVDLNQSDDQLLAIMKQKTRYNIRLSDRKGVKVRLGSPSDFDELFRMYAETSLRDNFVIRSKSYYLNVWKKIYDEGLCEPLIAEFEGEILAAVIIYYYGGKAYYMFGMSSDKKRNLMPTYLLQWKAIKRAKERKCRIYDLWGAPDDLNENDSMWGVYKFKLGFGGFFVRTIGAWDYPINKIGYAIYHYVIPKILNIMRKFGFRRTKTELE
ncbi:MAG: peptidoglycan bridge formation glycyltransferase FemA/FemB family protein [Anaerolineaceae bacterium]|nr:peptidoglycan bridge formation glycyltransferase FemA/FemB family protein [Anaerolineaceae bacterium]